MSVEPWYCRTCKRTITAVGPYWPAFGEGAHDEAIHREYQRRANRWIVGGLLLAGLGVVLQAVALLGRFAGWWT